jgi:hypothetical protein
VEEGERSLRANKRGEEREREVFFASGPIRVATLQRRQRLGGWNSTKGDDIAWDFIRGVVIVLVPS